jgi:hypothetical protein
MNPDELTKAWRKALPEIEKEIEAKAQALDLEGSVRWMAECGKDNLNEIAIPIWLVGWWDGRWALVAEEPKPDSEYGDFFTMGYLGRYYLADLLAEEMVDELVEQARIT